MNRKDKYKDTETFTYYNANPKNRITGDCVIRAISTGLNKDYNETLTELYNYQLKTGYMLNDKKCYQKYLDALGYYKEKQPKKEDNTKYTGYEFCKYIAKPNKRYIANIGGHHIVAIVNKKILDIWDSSNKSIGNYWEI